MPYSSTLFKKEIKDHIVKYISKDATILDIGAGCGTYGSMLRNDFKKIDAIEIYEPNVHRFGLMDIYRTVYVNNILDFKKIDDYDYFILGDVLEHIETKDAQYLIQKITYSGKFCLVAVPYNYEQGEYEGNKYEIHLQPDLTKEVFLERYPEMIFLMGDEHYGYFINYNY